MTPMVALAVFIGATFFRLNAEITHLSSACARDEANAMQMGGGRHTWQTQFARQIRFLQVLSGASPLLGLLGTVTGMLKTFQGFSLVRPEAGSVDLVARGIAEALITTEVGLVFGLAGLIAAYWLRVRRDGLVRHWISCESRVLLTTRGMVPC